jgi:hypothetical protein
VGSAGRNWPIISIRAADCSALKPRIVAGVRDVDLEASPAALLGLVMLIGCWYR